MTEGLLLNSTKSIVLLRNKLLSLAYARQLPSQGRLWHTIVIIPTDPNLLSKLKINTVGRGLLPPNVQNLIYLTEISGRATRPLQEEFAFRTCRGCVSHPAKQHKIRGRPMVAPAAQN